MTDARLVVPDHKPGETIKGPRSYFASVEKTYARPIQEWVDLVATKLEVGATHREVVAWLKSEHAMGHGHANAIVAWVKGRLA